MTTREWLEKAKKEGFAIPALNVGTLETFEVIMSTPEGTVRSFDINMLL